MWLGWGGIRIAGRLNMFQTLIHPSSGACDFSTLSPHWSCVLVLMCVGVLVWLGWGGIHVAGSLNMFRKVIHPSSGACDYSVELQHWSYCSWFDACCASACNTDTTPTQPHRNSNIHRTKNNMTNVVIQQNSHKLLMMDILMSKTC